jgi:hypothetical protein
MILKKPILGVSLVLIFGISSILLGLHSIIAISSISVLPFILVFFGLLMSLLSAELIYQLKMFKEFCLYIISTAILTFLMVDFIHINPDGISILAYTETIDFDKTQNWLLNFTKLWGGSYGLLVMGYAKYFRFVLLMQHVLLLLWFVMKLTNLYKKPSFLYLVITILFVLFSPMFIRLFFSVTTNLITPLILIAILESNNHSNDFLLSRKRINSFGIILGILFFLLSTIRLETIVYSIIFYFLMDSLPKKTVKYFIVVYSILMIAYIFVFHQQMQFIQLILISGSVPLFIFMASIKGSLSVLFKNDLNLMIFGMTFLVFISCYDSQSWVSMYKNLFSYEGFKRSWGMLPYLFFGSYLFLMWVRRTKWVDDMPNKKFVFTLNILPVFLFLLNMVVVIGRHPYRFGLGDSGNRMFLTVVLVWAALLIFNVENTGCFNKKLIESE